MSRFDDSLNQIVSVITDILRTIEAGELLTNRQNGRRGFFDLSYNFSIAVGLSNMLSSASAQRAQRLSREPLVDIIDSGKKIKVIILFPGANKEDLAIKVKETSIAITIMEQGQSHHLEIPCDVWARLVSARCENGVIEIVFRKREVRN